MIDWIEEQQDIETNLRDTMGIQPKLLTRKDLADLLSLLQAQIDELKGAQNEDN